MHAARSSRGLFSKHATHHQDQSHVTASNPLSDEHVGTIGVISAAFVEHLFDGNITGQNNHGLGPELQREYRSGVHQCLVNSQDNNEKSSLPIFLCPLLEL